MPYCRFCVSPKNVKVIFTPSFDEAEDLLSEPHLVAVFLDDHLGDERVGCGGCKLLEEAVELDTRPSLYSISDGTYFNELLIPDLRERYNIEIPILLKDDPELKGNPKLGHTPKVKDASQVISVIQAINQQYNADIKASMLLGAPEHEALNKA